MVTKSKTKKQASNAAKVAGTSASTAIATVGLTNLPAGIALVRRLTMPSLVMNKLGERRFLAIADALRVSKVPGKINKEGVQEKPATVCTVGDVETGEVFTWLVPAVVQSTFVQDYEGDSYVGKCFMVENLGKREGKRHIDFAVAEVDASGLTAQAGA